MFPPLSVAVLNRQGMFYQQAVCILFGPNTGCSTNDQILPCNKRLLTSGSTRVALGVTEADVSYLYLKYFHQLTPQFVSILMSEISDLVVFHSSFCFSPN